MIEEKSFCSQKFLHGFYGLNCSTKRRKPVVNNYEKGVSLPSFLPLIPFCCGKVSEQIDLGIYVRNYEYKNTTLHWHIFAFVFIERYWKSELPLKMVKKRFKTTSKLDFFPKNLRCLKSLVQLLSFFIFSHACNFAGSTHEYGLNCSLFSDFAYANPYNV